MIDNLGREWNIKFQNRQEAFRMLVFVVIARAALRAKKKQSPCCMVDVHKGEGKGCKEKQRAAAIVRAWRVLMNPGEGTLTEPVPPYLKDFNPIFDDTASIFTAQLNELIISESEHNFESLPKNFSDLLIHMKVHYLKALHLQTQGHRINMFRYCTRVQAGGQRLAVLPANSDVAIKLLR